MLWSNGKRIFIPQFKFTGSNQHGLRYKQIGSKHVEVVKLSLKTCSMETSDLSDLILLGDHLNIPVRYSFTEPQNEISIELVSAEVLRKLL